MNSIELKPGLPVEQIAALAIAGVDVKIVGDTFHAIVPPGYQVKDLTDAVEKSLSVPSRKRGTVVLSSVDSFVAYVKDQGGAHCTFVYADPDTRTLIAVMNDHGSGRSETGWRDFRAVYQAEFSREFAAWHAKNKEPLGQEAFAVFIEDNIADVVEPSGDELLKIALTLQAKTEVSFSSSKRLDNGQVQLSYTENIEARAGSGAIEIPREFAIGCRLFKNGDAYKIRARLKYRLGAGQVKFWYELDRPENVIEDAFKAYIEKARETGFTVLIGKP